MRPTSRSFRRSKRQRGPVRLIVMERFGPDYKLHCNDGIRLADLIPQQIVDCGLCTGLCIHAFDDDSTGQIGAGAAVW